MVRPFSLSIGLTPTGPRIGGPAPNAGADQFRDEHVQYFGTFPVDATREFSIFHRFEIFGDDDERDVIPHNNQILAPSELIWVLVHDASPRSGSSPNQFEAARLDICDAGTDIDDDNADVAGRSILSCNKLGGLAYIERHALMDAIPELESQGFSHLLQIGMNGDLLIDGFPWDPGFLNVWARDPLDANTFRFAIQQ